MSERPASSGENSTSSVYSRAHLTARTAWSITCEGSMRSFFSMWIGEVAMKVCTRGCAATRTASPQRRMSLSFARASPQITLSFTARATACTAAKSPSLAAGKPASITSTFMRSSWRPMRIFSSFVIDAPGLCSPSRIVVSNMIKCSLAMTGLLSRNARERARAEICFIPGRLPAPAGTSRMWGRSLARANAQQQAGQQERWRGGENDAVAWCEELHDASI